VTVAGGLLAFVAQQGAFFCATYVYFIACMLLGGGARSGYLSDAILQLLAVPLLIGGLWRYRNLAPGERSRAAILLPLLFAALPASQLVPLPPEVWSSLPGRELAAASFAVAGAELPWAPISVSPAATWLALVSLLPIAALFQATSLLSHQQRRWLSLAMLGVGLVSVFLGMAQVAQGPYSPLRFMNQGNASEAVGFFANRNHYAAFLYVLTIFAGVWALDATMRASDVPQASRLGTATILPPIIGFTVLVAFLAAQMIARSRAGLILSIVALAGVLVLALLDRRARSGLSLAKLLLGGTALAAVFFLQFALYRVVDRFSADPLADARLAFAGTTMEAGTTFMPLGAGVGTFVPVYATFEKIEDTIANTFANRAHNDFLELWLETGLPGIAILALGVMWLVWRSLRVWRLSSLGEHSVDLGLARAASIAVALVLVHSIVDYPARTAAMAVLVAFCCGLLLPAPASLERRVTVAWTARPSGRSRSSSGSEVAVRDPIWVSPLEGAAPGAQGAAGKREWMAQHQWPESWRERPRPRRPEKDDGGQSG
jgi:O-antigen ligase